MTEVVVRSGPSRGLRFRVDPQNEKYYWSGTYERAMQDALEELIQPGDVVWDIGAHIGFFSVLASRLVGPTGAVLAFEPVAANRLRLADSLRLNDADNVRVCSEAVGDKSGPVVLEPRGASSMWTIRSADSSQVGFTVECITLDAFAREEQAPTIIKIDVEDAELDVLRGARSLLRRGVKAVLIELLNPAVLDECLAAAEGYGARKLDGSHWLLTPTRLADDAVSAS